MLGGTEYCPPYWNTHWPCTAAMKRKNNMKVSRMIHQWMYVTRKGGNSSHIISTRRHANKIFKEHTKVYNPQGNIFHLIPDKLGKVR